MSWRTLDLFTLLYMNLLFSRCLSGVCTQNAMLKKECYSFQMMLSFIDVLLIYVCLPSEGFLRYTIHCVILKSQHEVKIYPIYFLNIHFWFYWARISAHYSNQRFPPLKRFNFLITLQIPLTFKASPPTT